jgi:hypothetical protein
LEFPSLYEIAIILLIIQSSQAFIERFFNICGVVCTKRATNMKVDLIIRRSMLKSNIDISDRLNNKIETKFFKKDRFLIFFINFKILIPKQHGLC